MNSIEFIKLLLENGKGWTTGLLQDMKENPLAFPTPNGGNHPLWVLGHITHSESNLLDVFILGQPNRFPELDSLFGMGSEPTDNADDYPSFDELFQKFEDMRAATLAHLDTLSEADLNAKSNAPEEFGPGFSTAGGCFTAMALHISFHTGQVADARRAVGKSPLMA